MAKDTVQMQGVDTILSVPQYYVNFNLAQLLETGTSISGGSLKDIQLDLGQNTWINGTLESLSVDFGVAGSTRKAKFRVKFAGGTMDYWDVRQNPPKKLSADISGLVFAMDADLSTKDLADDKDLPPDIKAQMKKQLKNLGPGSFTIQQLLMDVSAAAISAPDTSATEYPANFPSGAQAVFPQYMTEVMNDLKKAGGSSLGYAVKVDNPGHAKDPVATLPPTDLALVTNAYQPQGGAAKDPTLNCLNYLMMTGPNPSFPANPKPWWGNFVQPEFESKGMYGALTIRSTLFRDFVLEKLAPVACQYVTVVDNPDSLAMKTQAQTGTFTAADKGVGGSFSKYGINGTGDKGQFGSHDDTLFVFNFVVDLAIKPGTNTIVITRKTTFAVTATHWYGFKHHALTSQAKVVYTFPAIYTISLLGLVDGALQVAVKTDIPQEPPNYVSAEPYSWMQDSFTGGFGPFEGPMNTMTAAMNNGAEAAFPKALPGDLAKSLTDELNLHPFVFPGGSQLFMKNPAFTDEGDLLVGLSYKA